MAHRVVSDADAPPLDPGNLTLDALLHPLGKDAFLRPLPPPRRRRRGRRRGARRRSSQAAAGDVEAVAAASSSERLMLWVRGRRGAVGRGRRWGLPASRSTTALTSVVAEDARSAAALHGAGHALYCRGPPGLEASLVDALLGETSLGLPPRRGAGQLAGHGEVEMFCARKSHVTGWHYDFQENFTDQRKAAGLCHGRDRGAAPSSKKRKRDADDVDEFVLEAGDVLYFPAGLYHEVESLDDDNVSLNVSLVAPSWAEVITSSLRHCLSSREAFRARATSGPGAADDLRRLLGELKQIVGQLDVDKFTGRSSARLQTEPGD
ncbi:hypothetical protein JL722_13921 [Aureococcus anophagefferens]|nr:hypothetical protein JL722_13921 [Aureococcus anophagefferens]